MIIIKRINVIRMTSLFVSIVLVLCGFLIKAEKEKKDYKLQIENTFSKSLDDFNSAVNNISLVLNKIRFVTSAEQLSSMSAELLTEAEVSKTALAQLPYNSELTSLNKFLSQVGSYASSISKKLISGKEMGNEEAENLEALSNISKEISQIITDTQIVYNNPEYWAKELEKKLDKEIDDETLSASLEKLEGELTDLPTLIYDGPYSDHIYEKEPKLLKGAENIDENKAQEIAALFAECDKEDLKYNGFTAGDIPSYRFSGNNINVSVSKVGGYTVYMRKERQIKESLLTYEQAMEKAKRYLEKMGMLSFTATYYYTAEGVCTVNFAYLDGETICYTDLVKVGVAMDNGEIMLYEASGYISNHTSRAFETAIYTKEQAQEKVSKSLTINSVALALIPTKSGREARCYEFACRSQDNQDVMVYINALTLSEEEILILLKEDGGTLVK